MTEVPERPSDPRPNGEPYYINSQCPNCGEELVLYDKFNGNNEVWHDEWYCPECQDGIHLDVPEHVMDELRERVKETENE